jgi:hypothetical protein
MTFLYCFSHDDLHKKTIALDKCNELVFLGGVYKLEIKRGIKQPWLWPFILSSGFGLFPHAMDTYD